MTFGRITARSPGRRTSRLLARSPADADLRIAARILGEAIDLFRQGQVSLRPLKTGPRPAKSAV
jgi:hypothetical protein